MGTMESRVVLKPQVTQAIPNVENFLRHCQRKSYKAKTMLLKEPDASE